MNSPDPMQRISAIPRHWAELTPEAPALWERGRATSYREFMHAILAGAALLRERGVKKGDRVMIVAENCVAEIVLFFAAIELSAWPTIVNARMSDREIDVIRSALRAASATLYLAAFLPEAAAHARRADASELDEHLFPGVTITRTDESTRAEPSALASEVAMLLYTSGTTGTPKGVMLTHRGLLHFCKVSASSRALGPADCVYAVLPLAHIFGIATITLATLYAGASLCVEARFDPATAVAALSEQRITTLQGVPLMWRRLLAHMRSLLVTPDFSSLRYLYVGGGGLEPLLKAEVEHTFGLPVHHGYGMTEYAGSMFITRMDQPRPRLFFGISQSGLRSAFSG